MKENQQIEFKQSWRDEYLQYLCGFANAQGGTLYIGIDDNGTICGIANARKLLENLPNQIKRWGYSPKLIFFQKTTRNIFLFG